MDNNKPKNLDIEKAVRFSIILIGISLFYYFVFQPLLNWVSLNNCLNSVELEYQKQVNELKPSDYSVLQELDKYYWRNQDWCFKKYPQR